MARVDFYVIRGNSESNRQHFACRLAEIAYRQKNRVHIQVQSDQVARRLDELLWTFRDGSFVPHDIVNSSQQEATSAVTIAVTTAVAEPAANAPAGADLLINLTESIPVDIGSFPRIAEIVTSDDDSLARSRKNFVDYRQAGHALETHKI